MNQDWRGPIAFVLACGVSVALVGGIITAELTPGAVTTQEVSLFSTLAGAIVGAVAAYLGIQHNGGNDSMRETTETPERPPERDEPVEPEPVPAPDDTPEPVPETEPVPPEPVPEPAEEDLACPPETRREPREGQPWGLTDYSGEGGEDGS